MKQKHLYIGHSNYRHRLLLLSRSYIKDANKVYGYSNYSDYDPMGIYSERKKKKHTKRNKHNDAMTSKSVCIKFYDDINDSSYSISFYSISNFLSFCENNGYYIPIDLEDELYKNSSYCCCVDSNNYSIIGATDYTKLLYSYYDNYDDDEIDY